MRLRKKDCGGGEIRTLGGLPHTDFPGLRTRPLCDASNAGSYTPMPTLCLPAEPSRALRQADVSRKDCL